MTRRRGAQSARMFFTGSIVAVLTFVTPGLAEAVTVGTTTTFTISPNPAEFCYGQTWAGTVTANGPADGSDPTGTVAVYDVTNGAHTLMGTGAVSAGSTAISMATETCPDLGSHDLDAEFTSTNSAYSNSTSSPFSLTVTAGPAFVTIRGSQTFEQHSTAGLAMDVTAGHNVNGTLALYRQGNGTPICTLPNIASQGAGLPGCAIPTSTVGTFDYYATWTSSDTTKVLSGQSDLFQVVITADQVYAHSVVTQYASIYPVVDSYRDTDKISGYRDEPISVSIRITNSTGSLVKSASIALGTGAYSLTWNGRNSAGTILAEGTYKVTQTLKDAFNTTKIYATSVTLSKKHLIWHSSSVTKLGSSLTASGHNGAGTVSINTTYGYAKLNAPAVYVDWAGAGWQLTLPTAVTYKAITLKVYAKEKVWAGQDVRVGAQNFTMCGYSSTWDASCFDAWHSVGNLAGTLTWYSTGGVSSAHRYGRYVRVMVSVTGAVGAYVYKASVTFQYSTLGY